MQQQSSLRRSFPPLLVLMAVVAIVAEVFLVNPAHASPSSTFGMLKSTASAEDWTTYLGDSWRTSFNAAESILTPSNVAQLKLKWSQFAADGVSVQPVEANDVVYWGSWDGYEHAFTTAGVHLWDTQIGQT